MIENYRTGNIFEQPDINVIVHQCNLYHTFGAGIAKIIADKYPEAYEADKKTPYGNEEKLGTFSFAKSDRFAFFNLYSQLGVGGPERNTSYDMLDEGLRLIKDSLEIFLKENPTKILTLGIPYGIGSNLAGGSWKVVEQIIENVFDNANFDVIICKLPNQEELK